MMTMIGRMIARMMGVIRNWWRRRKLLSTTRFAVGGKSECFIDGTRITYNTDDVIELDQHGKVIAYKTHDGLEWRHSRAVDAATKDCSVRRDAETNGEQDETD
jgi:hypothetical protein